MILSLSRRARAWALPAVMLLALPFAAPAHADGGFTPEQRQEIVNIVRDALKTDPSILRDAIAALQAQAEAQRAEELRKTLAARQKDLVTPADPVTGNVNGDVTIVEFFDVRCPYCRKMEPDMASLLGQDHGVRLVYKDLPILGPGSVLASRALLAAIKQGKYDALRTELMAGPAAITDDTIKDAATRQGLDVPRLLKDMEDPAVQLQLNTNLQLAKDLGIDGTPALVIGDSLTPGVMSLAELQTAVGNARKNN